MFSNVQVDVIGFLPHLKAFGVCRGVSEQVCLTASATRNVFAWPREGNTAIELRDVPRQQLLNRELEHRI